MAELNVLAKSRGQLLELKLNAVKTDLASLASSSATQTVLKNLSEVMDAEKSELTEILSYFQTPIEPAERAKLTGTGNKSIYAFHHKKIHRSFSTNWLNAHYGDIYILNVNGDIVYSVAKSTDFLTNVSANTVSANELAETEISKLYEKVKQKPVGSQYSSQFSIYSAAPVLFIAEPVWSASVYRYGIHSVGH